MSGQSTHTATGEKPGEKTPEAAVTEAAERAAAGAKSENLKT